MTQSSPRYPTVDANPDFPALENEILVFWRENGVFERSVNQRPAIAADGSSNAYVFYDGPPFANGLPHYGHLLTGYVKDAIARYHTLRGKRVERRFGWDCHGLPAEMGAEKELGISGRAAIAEYGIGKFNAHCRESVMKYTKEWEYYVTRQGRWVDFKNDYKTMDKDFMESVIWAFWKLYKEDLIYESMRVMPYSWAAETPVSNFETRLDNATREREDKAAYVKFKLADGEKPDGAPDAKNYYLIAWTTTPWTLPSNLALAISSDIEYGAVLDDDGSCIIAAKFALPKLNKEWSESATVNPHSLIGAHYEPLFPYFAETKGAFRVLKGDFVTEGDGTGIVHMAPGFGEVDQACCNANGIETLVPVDEKGRFTSDIFDIPWQPGEQETGAKRAAGLPPASGRSNPPLRIWEGVGTHADSTRLAPTLKHAEELRNNLTEAEKKLWAVLSNKKIGDKKFRRQHSIGSYIVDFVCTGANLIVELDGGHHAEQVEYDAKRTAYLESQHYRVLRFWNNEVLENLEGVVAVIEEALSHPPESAKDADSTSRQREVSSLQLCGLVVVPDSRMAESDIVVSEEDAAKHITPKDVAKYGLANMRIVRWLKANNKLVKDEPFKHNYPHCWRTDTPLIYRAMSSWYVDVPKIKSVMAENNRTINWIPNHVRDGQMGHMIDTAPGWSISRNRFWGTPIPIWKSPSGKLIVPGSIAEIEALSGKKVEDLHRPFIDEIAFTKDGETYTRIEDVFDCWFESGSMPYAQLHYPFENKERFKREFPADFITEYIAQTRGWFNTLITLSAGLFGVAPFKNVICHGVVIDEETGLKYSKRLKNYKDPKEVMDQFGADALRWLMLASPVMRGADLAVDPDGKFIRDVVRLNIKPLWSAYNFFTLYANADGVVANQITVSENLLDRYILAKCKAAVRQVQTSMDAYDTPGATEAITGFFEVLNNWYIRRSRARFWAEELSADKQAAYNTLFTVLNLMCIAAAPLLPFTAEAIYRGLNGNAERGAISVHLADFPDVGGIDSALELIADMDRVRDACTAMGAIRSAENIRNRQPLASATLYGAGASRLKPFSGLMEDEINVKEIRFADSLEGVAEYTLTIDFKVAGKRLGGKMKAVGAAAKAGDWKREGDQILVGGEPVERGEYTLRLKSLISRGAQPLAGNDALVVLDLNITPELEAEGRARDLVRMIQQARKDAGLNVADRIALALDVPEGFKAALNTHRDYIAEQTLAVSLSDAGAGGAAQQLTQELDGAQFTIGITRAA